MVSGHSPSERRVRARIDLGSCLEGKCQCESRTLHLHGNAFILTEEKCTEMITCSIRDHPDHRVPTQEAPNFLLWDEQNIQLGEITVQRVLPFN